MWTTITALVLASSRVFGQGFFYFYAALTIPPNKMDPPITDIDSEVLFSVLKHVFLPPKLPQTAPTDGAECETIGALCNILIQAARDFRQYLLPTRQSIWNRMIEMMETIYRTAQEPLLEDELEGALSDLAVGGGLISHTCCIIVYITLRCLRNAC